MTADPNAPIDQLHADCVQARREIRDAFSWARQLASEWNLRDMPESFR